MFRPDHADAAAARPAAAASKDGSKQAGGQASKQRELKARRKKARFPAGLPIGSHWFENKQCLAGRIRHLSPLPSTNTHSVRQLLPDHRVQDSMPFPDTIHQKCPMRLHRAAADCRTAPFPIGLARLRIVHSTILGLHSRISEGSFRKKCPFGVRYDSDQSSPVGSQGGCIGWMDGWMDAMWPHGFQRPG